MPVAAGWADLANARGYLTAEPGSEEFVHAEHIYAEREFMTNAYQLGRRWDTARPDGSVIGLEDYFCWDFARDYVDVNGPRYAYVEGVVLRTPEARGYEGHCWVLDTVTGEAIEVTHGWIGKGAHDYRGFPLDLDVARSYSNGSEPDYFLQDAILRAMRAGKRDERLIVNRSLNQMKRLLLPGWRVLPAQGK
jgi:hypothetical protein